MAVEDLGINRMRLSIRSGTENPVDWFSKYMNGEISRDEFKTHWNEVINDNDDPHSVNPAGFQFADLDHTIEHVILPMRQKLAQNGSHLWVNVDYVDFRPSAFKLKTDPAEYAEFVLVTYRHMQEKYGFTPDSWEVILEPDNAEWTPEQIGRAIVAAGDLLKANGFIPNFVAPATTSMRAAVPYFSKIALIPGAVDYIGELSYHRYAGTSIENLQSIARLAQEHEVNTAMLEWIGATYETLHEDLKVGNNSAWQQFALAYCGKDSGAQYFIIDNANPGKPSVNWGMRTYFLRQYFKYIMRGATRIEALTTNRDFDPISFINPGNLLVVVVKAHKSGDIIIEGLPAGTYEISYTTGDAPQEVSPITLDSNQQGLSTNIPAKGVITIHQVLPVNELTSGHEDECR